MGVSACGCGCVCESERECLGLWVWVRLGSQDRVMKKRDLYSLPSMWWVLDQSAAANCKSIFVFMLSSVRQFVLF